MITDNARRDQDDRKLPDKYSRVESLHLPGSAETKCELGDLVYSENIGAYSHALSTYFNGFPPAKVVHVYQ